MSRASVLVLSVAGLFPRSVMFSGVFFPAIISHALAASAR